MKQEHGNKMLRFGKKLFIFSIVEMTFSQKIP